MIFAELKGKLGSNSERAHERAEDLLTSTVFGLLRYVSGGSALMSVLCCARQVLWEGERLAVAGGSWLVPDGAATAELQFWPNWGAYGQPDVLAELRSRSGELVGVVLVEVKLYSPKSGGPGVDDEETSEEAAPDPDQLVKYWQGLRRRAPAGVRTAIVYLTAHSSAPAKELSEALRRMPGMTLGWMSWFDVHREVKALASVTGNLAAADLRDLLEHKGLAHFSGFRSRPPAALVSGRLWHGRARRVLSEERGSLVGRAAEWFSRPAPSIPVGQRLWREE